MKAKLDENIPVRLSSELAKLGHEIDTVASEGDTVASEGLTGKPDADVWSAAKREQRFLITQDLDFSDMRQFKPGTHAGLLLVRLREPGANTLVSRIKTVIQDEGLESFAGCFALLTDRKLRVRRP
jgi:predicted nuclease of predicted toxin-antitoxin system